MPWTPSKGTSIHGVYSPTATCAVSLPTVTAIFPVAGSITTEKGAFWGMLIGYVGGGVWFLLIKWALWIDLQAPPGYTPLREIWVFLLTRDGVGLDPSYVTTVIPLITVPAVSLLTRASREGADAQAEVLFRERLKAAEPEVRLTSAGLH